MSERGGVKLVTETGDEKLSLDNLVVPGKVALAESVLEFIIRIAHPAVLDERLVDLLDTQGNLAGLFQRR